jgi:Tfp pilus assembly protein PilW
MRTRSSKGRAACSRSRTSARRRGRGEKGLTLVELTVMMGVVVTVLAAGITTYLGTTRSWEGTATLAEAQRDASLAMEIMTRAVRSGTQVSIGPAGDSLAVTLWTGSTDSLLATYYHDDSGCGYLRDMSGNALVAGLDSLLFTSSDGRTVNLDVVIRRDRGTAEPSDDQAVLMSSTVTCRN